MRIRRSAVVLALALLGVVAGGLTFASASTKAPALTAWGLPVSAAPAQAAAPDITTAKSLIVKSRNEQRSYVDTLAHGTSAGDLVTVQAPVFDTAGTKVGRLDVTGAITQAGPNGAAQLFFTVALPKGQVMAQGVQRFTSPAGFTAAVTGGTYAYQNARGQVRVDFTSSGATFTFHLLP